MVPTVAMTAHCVAFLSYKMFFPLALILLITEELKRFFQFHSRNLQTYFPPHTSVSFPYSDTGTDSTSSPLLLLHEAAVSKG